MHTYSAQARAGGVANRMLFHVAAVLLVGLPWSGWGAALTWNGGVGADWVNGGAGWLNGGSPATWNNATPDAATFGGTAPLTLTINAGGITAGNLAFISGDYTLGGSGTLTLNTGAIQVDSGLTTVMNQTLAGAAGLTKTGAGTLSLVNNTKNYTGTTVINDGAIQILAATGGSLGSSSSGNVTLNGGRLQTLFSGNITVNYNFTVGASGGELRNLGTDTQRFVLPANKLNGSGPLTISFGSNATRFQLGSTQTGFSGKWIIDSGGDQGRYIDINALAVAPFGTGTGDDAITFQNSGTMLVRNGVTIGSASQGITLGSGETKISAAGTSSITLAGKISGPVGNDLQLYPDSVSTVVVANVNNSWLGALNLATTSRGVVLLGASGVLPDQGGTVTLTGPTTLDLNGYNEVIGGLSGFGTVDVRVASANVTLGVGGNQTDSTFQGTLTNRGAGATMQLVKVGTNTLSLLGAGIGHAGGTIISNGIIQISAAGAGRLGASASSPVTLAGGMLQGNFSADTTVNNVITVGAAGGTLRNLGGDPGRWLMADNTITGSGILTLAFGTVNTRFALANSQSAFTGKWIVNSGGNANRFVDVNNGAGFGGATGDDAITLENTGTLLLRNGVLLGSASQGITLGTGEAKITGAGNSTSTLSGKISGLAGRHLQIYTDTAGSVVIISNTANAWLGNTSLNGLGLVRVGNAGVFPDNGGSVGLASATLLDLNGYHETLAGLNGSGRVDNQLAGSSATLSVGANNASTTFAGAFTNSASGATLAVTKVGSGTLTLSGASGHSGLTTVQAGALRVTGVMALGNTVAGTTVDSGAALELQGSITITNENLILDGTGVGGAGVLRNISGNNTWLGPVQLNNSAALTIASDSGDLKLKGTITQTGGVPPTFQGGGNIFIDGGMNGGFTRGSGAGDVVVSKGYTVTGDVTVSASAVGAIKFEGALEGNVTLNGGQLTGTGSVQVATLNNGLLSPNANFVGRYVVSALNFSGGAYQWTVTNAAGLAGVNSDLITVGNGAGTVDLSGAGTASITVRVQCTQSTLPNFDHAVPSSWMLVDAGSVIGFAASKFTVNDSAFTPGSEGGTWSVSSSGGNLYLDYTPGLPVDLAIRATASPDPAPVGDTITYTITVTNNTAALVNSYSVTGRLAAGMTYLGSSDGGSHGAGVVSWTLSNLAASGSKTLTLTVNSTVQGQVALVSEVWPRRLEALESNNRYTNSITVFCPSAGVVGNSAPASRVATNGQSLSFTVSASNADCNAPFLYAAGLPSGAYFTAVTNAYTVTGTFVWPFPTSGTHPVQFFSYNATKVTSTVVTLIHVDSAGQPQTGGQWTSQTNWYVEITDLQVPSSGNVTVVWDAVEGITYDLYTSTDPIGGGAVWTKVVDGLPADGNQASATVANATSMRFYQVVPQGLSRMDRGVWGVVLPTIAANSYTMLSAPLDIADRSMGGELGDALKAVLSNGDKVFAMTAGGGWVTITLSGGNWDTAYTFAEGEGFFVERNGSAVTPRFTGPVGNDGGSSRTINGAALGRWNILGPSQGKTLSFASAFGSFTGTPTANWNQNVADVIAIDQGGGVFKRYFRSGDGVWRDASNLSTSIVNPITPGKAVYYFHYGTGSLSINF